MSGLLDCVLAAHGGAENWSRVTTLTAEVSLGGVFWAARGWSEVYRDQHVGLDARRQHIVFSPFTAPGTRSVFDVDPERVVIEHADGSVVDERLDPRSSFPLPFDMAQTRWDAVQVAYFTSAAVWNYLTQPFSLAYPGVITREIDPWIEDGETWRRLAVTFPARHANHNPEQVFYYDERFLQRRMDYSPYVTGGPPVAHYTHDHETFDGFVFPTRRRVHLHGPNGVANQELAPITLDVTQISVTRIDKEN